MDILAALQVYKELADWYERQGHAAMRDRFLILAAEAAFAAGKPDEAERLRQRLLLGNPHHMLKPFSSFAQALQSTNIQIYIHDLQANYPPETVEQLRENLRSGVPPTPPDTGLGDSTLGTVPQTAPLIEIRDEPTLPLGGSMDSLKVYPLRDEPEPALPPSPPVKPTHLNRPSARKPGPSPPTVAPPDRPSTLNTLSPRSQPTLPRSPRPPVAPAPVPLPPPSEAAAPAGAWLPLVLFGMTVTAGVALAVYTLARPFLPREWLP
ncbi:MAG TPA: hypothetical protein VMG10_11900 [Gemmataceae bacterium]|nr:hypothetical protein [Gemmataceae bacterium]